MAALKARYGAPLVLFRSARLAPRRPSRWRARRPSTACSWASPRTACWPLAALDSIGRLRPGPEPDLPARRPRSCRIAPTDRSPAFSTRRTRPGICSTCPPTACRSSTSRTCWWKRRAGVRTRATSASRRFIRDTSSASGAPRPRRRDRTRLPRVRPDVLLSLGRHRHAQREEVQRVLRGAHRAQAADSVVRQRARRQPDRPRRS